MLVFLSFPQMVYVPIQSCLWSFEMYFTDDIIITIVTIVVIIINMIEIFKWEALIYARPD